MPATIQDSLFLGTYVVHARLTIVNEIAIKKKDRTIPITYNGSLLSLAKIISSSTP
jgi:hypothetical protein